MSSVSPEKQIPRKQITAKEADTTTKKQNYQADYGADPLVNTKMSQKKQDVCTASEHLPEHLLSPAFKAYNN